MFFSPCLSTLPVPPFTTTDWHLVYCSGSVLSRTDLQPTCWFLAFYWEHFNAGGHHNHSLVPTICVALMIKPVCSFLSGSQLHLRLHDSLHELTGFVIGKQHDFICPSTRQMMWTRSFFFPQTRFLVSALGIGWKYELSRLSFPIITAIIKHGWNMMERILGIPR